MGDLLMTGAAGGAGSFLRPLLRECYGRVILSDRAEMTDLVEGEEFRQAELSDPQAIAAALQGVDRVIHLGGQPVEADWDTVNASNIAGLHTFYEAARAAGVKRVVFASSNHAIGFYGRHRRIGADDRVRPDSLYGVSKAFGEALAALYADKHGIGTLSIRIGNVAMEPADTRRLSMWLHPEDLMQLCVIGLEHPEVHNQVVFGASGNARTWWDNSAAFALGYRPAFDAEHWAADAVKGDGAPDPVGDRFQGGGFCSQGFEGDVERNLWH
ncbi:NAD-dependent epimerase/dehydratase family protein [Tranquillimonas alkanivorans]|uniref:Uronate dehydrogenase n=1 Tax=Tranquillimonas alkanivorans TaxID=441119 RepID=A0A1I5PK32_9RHOB|nr:NAD(P)-dependent oxidoreductase [Tranquillimonas alkanivorans]SFP34363.1 uronate dehydrogenase [Tranquillimonas alkanivorans]